MNKHFKIILPITVCMLFFSFCSSLKNDVQPHPENIYHALTIKVNVKTSESHKRQNFKIILKYDGTQDKMFFLSPLNQVYGQLFIRDERALLINTKQKKYWRGDFSTLIRRIWGVDFSYTQFKELVTTGKIPREKTDAAGIHITLEYLTDSRTLRQIIIVRNNVRFDKNTRGSVTIKLKLSNSKSGKGVIDFSYDLKGMKKANIDGILDSD